MMVSSDKNDDKIDFPLGAPEQINIKYVNWYE